MFEQHPVPQAVSSYQFKLVGDMTLKQFFQLAGGVGIALLVYSSPLPSIFKWPLIIVFVILGAAFAFFPVQDRPLEQWFVAFFRAAYGPTLFKWRKIDPKPNYFSTTNTTQPLKPVESLNPPVVETANEPTPLEKMEKHEETFLSKVSSLATGKVETETTNDETHQVGADDRVVFQRPTILSEDKQSVKIPGKPGDVILSTPQVAKTEVGSQGYTTETGSSDGEISGENVTQTLATNPNLFAVTPDFAPDVAPPSLPEMPNILVGQVVTNDKKIVDGAIMEIKDQEGRPVRALRSNKVGHFMIVTPLPNGSYTIQTEKQGLEFDPVSIVTNGEILKPIAIKAK